jgi:hypothetical protein
MPQDDLPPIQSFNSDSGALPPITPFEETKTASSSPEPGLPPIQSFDDSKTLPLPKHPTPDPSIPWYERTWDYLNTPLVNLNPENRGGFIGGTEDVISGLSSPLSIGLTAATLGGGALLRGLGLAAEELPVAVRGIKALVDAGFTAQGAIQAAKESPRVLDALKEGDYENAERLAVHVLAGGAVTYLGGKHLVKDAGPLFDEAAVKLGYKVKPSEENLKIRDNIGKYQADVTDYGKRAENLTDEWHKQFDKLSPTDREGVMYLMQAGLDREKLISRHNMLAEAAGRPESRVPNAQGSPETGPKFRLGTPTTIDSGPSAIAGMGKRYPIFQGDSQIGEAQVFIKDDGSATISWLGPEKPTGQELQEGYGRLSNQLGPAAIRDLARQFKAANPEIKKIEGMRIGGLGGRGGDVLAPREIPIDKLIGHEDEAHATPSLPDSDVPDAEKLARYKELIKQGLLKEKYKPEEIDKLLDAYKAGAKATPEMLNLARQARDVFSEWLEKAQTKGVIHDAVNNYVTQIWDKDVDNPAANRLLQEANSGGFHTNVSMARHRVFENAFEGQLLGRKLAVTDPIQLTGNYINKVGESIAARDFLERLRDTHVRASDGRPTVAMSGTGQLVEEAGNPAILVNPNTIRNVRIADKVISALKQSGDLDKFLADGKIVNLAKEGEPMYAWNTHDYRSIDHPAMHDWNYGAQVPGATPQDPAIPIMVKGELRVHPEAHEYLNRFLGGEKSLLKESKPVAAALKVGGELKHTMLSLSPFHIVQEGLRALMTGVSPFGVEKWNPEADPMLGVGVEESLTLGKDRRSLQDFQEGVHGSGQSKLISKIPVVRDIQDHLQHFLFDKYIPGLKVRAYKSLFERYRNAIENDPNFKGETETPTGRLAELLKERPDLKNSKVRAAARLAAEDTNERFGGLNYKQFGRAAGSQDFLRLATLAPDWLESELRFMKRVFTGGGEGSVARSDFVRMTVGLWGAARVLNLLTTGKPHMEAPFGVAHVDSEGKEKIYSVRALPTDIMHAVSDPYDFLRGRISPLGRIASEVYTGRDYAGRKQTPFNTIVDVVRGSAPIPAQAAIKSISGETPDLGSADQAVKALGGTAQIYKTSAQNKAAQLASEKSESGPVDPAQLRKHHALIEFEDRVRSGEMPVTDIHKMVEDGALPVKDAKAIIMNVKETQGLDPEMARLYTRASRLPMRDFLSVWDAAGNDEKAALTKLLLKKKASYFKKVMKELTPDERKEDSTYLRLRKLFPVDEPW